MGYIWTSYFGRNILASHGLVALPPDVWRARGPWLQSISEGAPDSSQFHYLIPDGAPADDDGWGALFLLLNAQRPVDAAPVVQTRSDEVFPVPNEEYWQQFAQGQPDVSAPQVQSQSDEAFPVPNEDYWLNLSSAAEIPPPAVQAYSDETFPVPTEDYWQSSTVSQADESARLVAFVDDSDTITSVVDEEYVLLSPQTADATVSIYLPDPEGVVPIPFVPPIPPVPASAPTVQIPPLQGGGQPIPGIDADKQREKDAFWIAVDEDGNEQVVYTDEQGKSHAIEDGDFWVYADEKGVETIVTAEEARIIARVLCARTSVGTNASASVIYSAHARLKVVVLSSHVRTEIVEAKTSVSSPRARSTVVVSDEEDGDG